MHQVLIMLRWQEALLERSRMAEEVQRRRVAMLGRTGGGGGRESTDGLVVLLALYGDLQRSCPESLTDATQPLAALPSWHPTHARALRRGLTSPRTIDVTGPVQLLVEWSDGGDGDGGAQQEAGNGPAVPTEAAAGSRRVSLRLAAGGTKSGLEGFWDPCDGYPKQLLVRYSFLGKIHQVVIDDDHGVRCPLRRHIVAGAPAPLLGGTMEPTFPPSSPASPPPGVAAVPAPHATSPSLLLSPRGGRTLFGDLTNTTNGARGRAAAAKKEAGDVERVGGRGGGGGGRGGAAAAPVVVAAPRTAARRRSPMTAARVRKAREGAVAGIAGDLSARLSAAAEGGPTTAASSSASSSSSSSSHPLPSAASSTSTVVATARKRPEGFTFFSLYGVVAVVGVVGASVAAVSAWGGLPPSLVALLPPLPAPLAVWHGRLLLSAAGARASLARVREMVVVRG
jgi:hypothetical protein